MAGLGNLGSLAGLGAGGAGGAISGPLMIVLAIGLVVIGLILVVFGIVFVTIINFFVPAILVILGLWLFVTPKRGIPVPWNYIIGLVLILIGFITYYVVRMM